MKSATFLFILFILTGCDEPSYRITSEGIQRDHPIQEGFHLLEIEVTGLNEEGRPIAYTSGNGVFCGPIHQFANYLGKTMYSPEEKEQIECHRKIIDTIVKLNNQIIGGEGHDNRIMEFIDSQNTIDSIVKKNFPFEPQKKIYFHEKSPNYKWVFTLEGVANSRFYDYSRKVFDQLPMELKKNQWYLMNFSNASNIIDEVYFLITDNGEIEQHAHYKVRMGV